MSHEAVETVFRPHSSSEKKDEIRFYPNHPKGSRKLVNEFGKLAMNKANGADPLGEIAPPLREHAVRVRWLGAFQPLGRSRKRASTQGAMNQSPPGPWRSLGGYLDYTDWTERDRFVALDRAYRGPPENRTDNRSGLRCKGTSASLRGQVQRHAIGQFGMRGRDDALRRRDPIRLTASPPRILHQTAGDIAWFSFISSRTGTMNSKEGR